METKKTIYFCGNLDKIEEVDPRLKPFLNGWTAWETYKGNRVDIPSIFPLMFFEYLPDNVEDREKQLVLGVGWEGFDIEATITVGIFAEECDPNYNGPVQVEISRHGGAPMVIERNGKVFCKFGNGWSWLMPPGYKQGYFSAKVQA